MMIRNSLELGGCGEDVAYPLPTLLITSVVKQLHFLIFFQLRNQHDLEEGDLTPKAIFASIAGNEIQGFTLFIHFFSVYLQS